MVSSKRTVFKLNNICKIFYSFFFRYRTGCSKLQFIPPIIVTHLLNLPQLIQNALKTRGKYFLACTISLSHVCGCDYLCPCNCISKIKFLTYVLIYCLQFTVTCFYIVKHPCCTKSI